MSPKLRENPCFSPKPLSFIDEASDDTVGFQLSSFLHLDSHKRGSSVATSDPIVSDGRQPEGESADGKAEEPLQRPSRPSSESYSNMTRAELVERLRSLESGQAAQEREALIHDLEVHQVELETQNQQLRETQALLEESRARYADLYDFAPVAYCMFDANGCIIEINLNGAALLGLDRSSLIGKPFTLLISQLDRGAFLKHLKACLGRDQATTELVLTLKTKTPIIIRLMSSNVLYGTSAMVGCRAVLADISAQKQDETALLHAIQMREDFLAIVSHDLRNPLASLAMGTQGLLRMIPEGAPGLAGSRRMLELMQRAADRMYRLLEDLLDLSSMDAGHLSMHRKSHDVTELVIAVIDIVGPLAAKKSIRLAAKSEAKPLLAYCDRDRIIQVLLNLISNSIKFTPEGGLVEIATALRSDEVLVSVRDTGVGIASPQLAHVFDTYWQAETTPGKGVGLGLSIAKGIVEFHGGKMWAESELDQGSTFTFTLPTSGTDSSQDDANNSSSQLAAIRAGQDQPSPGDGPAPPSSQLILVVDNDEDIRDSLAGILSAEKYTVATFPQGAAALKYLQKAKSKPLLILLDIDMPVMDGWQFLAHRAQDEELAKIPVIVISGAKTGRAVRALLGQDSYLPKPIEISTLLHKVAHLVRSSSLPHS